MNYPKVAQAVCFAVVVIEFISFSFGWFHVPTSAEDAKFFYMLFGIINTILAVPALTYAVQKANDFVAKPIQDKEIKNENVETDSDSAAS